MMGRSLIAALAVLLAALSTPAAAHLLPRQNATLHVVGDKGYLVISVPASTLGAADEDGDGLLSAGEVDRHRSAIATRIRSGFTVSTGKAASPFAFLWLADPVADAGTVPAGQGSPYLIAMAGVSLAPDKGPVKVWTDLFGTSPDERQMTLRAHRGNDVEMAQLTPLNPAGTVFQSQAGLFVSMVETGMMHILGGADHLLFLLTLLIAGVTFRQLAVQVTAFTVAHSVTLALTAFGLVHADPRWVEPGIALSIVVVALLNLFGRGHGVQMRAGIVFACGLLHGLGFASALDSIAGNSGGRLIMLAGFNLGIEAGQAMFLGLVLALVWGARRLPVRTGAGALQLGPRLASATAALSGMLMVAERTVPGMPPLGF